MKNSYHLLIILSAAILSSCYSLNTHQSGKTLGKGNATFHGITGFEFTPENIGSSNNEFFRFSEAQGFAAYGLRDDLDIGVFLGLIKAGFFIKHQFVGDLDTKFNVSGGLNAVSGSHHRSIRDYFRNHENNLQRVELPLYFSYDIHKNITLYSNPILTYLNETGSFNQNDIFYQTGFYRGLSNGVMLTLPVEKDKFVITIDSALLSPIMESNYSYFITVGFGVRFSTGWNKKN